MKIEEKDIDELLQYEALVYSIINKYSNYQDREDLYQVGMMGLKQAWDHYIPNEACKFSSYAYKYILGNISQYIRMNSSIKISKDSIRLKRNVEKTKDILRQKLFREPTTLELSLYLDLDEEKIIEIENLPMDAKSLDYEFGESEQNLYNSIKIEDQETKAEIMDLKEQISKLDEKEQRLIYSRYFVNLTQSETSKQLGISQAKVSRQETKILQKLKDRL